MSHNRRAAARIKTHIANLGNPDREISRRAEYSLIRYYGARALESLIQVCSHENSQVRYRAVWALGHTRDPRAFETVLRLTEDQNGEVRYDAALALGRLGDARAIGPLLALMQQPDEQHAVDSAAAMGLEDFGTSAVPALLGVLSQVATYARFLAIHTLGSIGDRRAVEPLAALLTDNDADIRIAAIEALAEIGGSDCQGYVAGCLQDPSPRVRETAEYWTKDMETQSAADLPA